MGLMTWIGRVARHRREIRLLEKEIEDDGVEEGKRKLGFLREEIEEEVEVEENMVVVVVELNRNIALSIIT